MYLVPSLNRFPSPFYRTLISCSCCTLLLSLTPTDSFFFALRKWLSCTSIVNEFASHKVVQINRPSTYCCTGSMFVPRELDTISLERVILSKPKGVVSLVTTYPLDFIPKDKLFSNSVQKIVVHATILEWYSMMTCLFGLMYISLASDELLLRFPFSEVNQQLI